jgi:hypothetical protein
MTVKTTTNLTINRGRRLRRFVRRQDRWRLMSVLLVALVLIGGSVREALRERAQVLWWGHVAVADLAPAVWGDLC